MICDRCYILTLLLVVDDVLQQQVIVTQHDGTSEVRQNAVHQVNFGSQLLATQRQLLKAGTANSTDDTNRNKGGCAELVTDRRICTTCP